MEELCKKATEMAGAGQVVTIANYLCPGNYAVSGSVPAIEVRPVCVCVVPSSSV